MKVSTMSALAGLGGALILSGSANAAYTGLSVELHTTITLPAGVKNVYRVYATFSGANDYVTAIAGSDIVGNLNIENTNAAGTGAGTGFFNPAGTSGAPILTPYSPPAFTWETFATIGGPIYTAANLTGFSPSFPDFIAGTSLVSNNISWFTAGPVEQGRSGAYAGNRVLIMQLTVADLENVRGTVSISGVNAGALAAVFTSNGQTFNSAVLPPAPGALALLGLAGLAGTRRRRA